MTIVEGKVTLRPGIDKYFELGSGRRRAIVETKYPSS